MEMFGFDRFTNNARRILALSQTIATDIGPENIGTEHILLAILSEKIGVAYDVLSSFGVDFERIEMAINLLLKSGERDSRSQGISGDLRRSLEKAIVTARQFNHFYVGSEHILYGILSSSEYRAYQLIQNIDVNPSSITRQIENIFRNSTSTDVSDPEMMGEGVPVGGHQMGRKKSIIDTYAIDLTAEAKEGKLDPTIGRDEEIERVIHIITRKTKNNPVLIGDPGVGKTAIVEGLAQRIVDGKVPVKLKNRRICSLDLGAMVAGTKFRGEFEDRMKKLLNEVEKDRSIILFIDELHSIIGAGAAEGSVDAGNMLKPALSRGKITCIGATTSDEYRKYIERDAAFERRFQPIMVEEPTLDDTIIILKGIAQRYEDFHQVTVEPEAIRLAAKLAHRYISDRFLPDKAIDLLDEASSAVVIRDKVGESSELKKLEKRLTETIKGKDKAIADQAFELAASLRDQEMFLKDEIEKLNEAKHEIPRGERAKVVSEDIAKVVHRWTGVPITKLIESDKKKFIDLESILSKRIIGQDEAISAISQAIRRSRAGISDPKRPIGSFIFLGPTGVGKTELAKVLAEEIYERGDALIKIDMSEFMEKHNVSRLVGAPAGYVGYEDGGKLTEQVRKKPYSVVLFDEIEKAHPEVFNLLLQILEDGYLTDAKGRRVDFRNTIIIMTSNIGISELSRSASLGFQAKSKEERELAQQDYERMKEEVLSQMKKSFNPEFLNRIDNTIVFKALDPKSIARIVNINIDALTNRVRQEKDISLELTDKAKLWIAERGFDAEYGARPIRRLIGTEIENRLAEGIISSNFRDKDTVRIDVKNKQIVLEKKDKKKTISIKSK